MLTMMRKYAVILAAFAALATALNSVVYWLTEPIITVQVALEKKMQLDLVLPTSLYDNDIQNNCYIVTNNALGNNAPHRLYLALKQGLPIAVALESTAPDGYSGAINLLIAADFKGNVLGVRVLEHHETPGLGDKIEARISDWILSFSGKSVSTSDDARWNVKKDNGEFDQFTGATITPRAVVQAVKNTVIYLKDNPQLFEQLPRCEEQ